MSCPALRAVELEALRIVAAGCPTTGQVAAALCLDGRAALRVLQKLRRAHLVLSTFVRKRASCGLFGAEWKNGNGTWQWALTSKGRGLVLFGCEVEDEPDPSSVDDALHAEITARLRANVEAVYAEPLR